MFKRILAILLASATLAAIAAAPSAGESEKRLSTDPCAPVAIADGTVTVSVGTTANELLSCFNDRFSLTLKGADGTPLDGTAAVGSGATVSLGEDAATVIVPGDVDGNAKINARDAVCAMMTLTGSDTGAFSAAIDVDANGEANGGDVVMLMKYLTGWDVSFGAEREKAASEDDALTVYFASTMLRIAENDMTVHGESDGVVRMAKNELEDAHIMLTSTEQKSELTLEIGDIKNAAGDVLEREVRYGYYYGMGMLDETLHQSREKQVWSGIPTGRYTDPYPKLRAPFAIGANCSKSFLVKIKTTADTAAGWYSATVRVLDASKNELKKATLRVYVWNFALDETPACKTLFGMDSASMAWNTSCYDGAVWTPAYANDWFEYSVENRIVPWGLPVGEYTDKYMDDPRVTSFVSATGSRDASAWDKEGFAEEVQATYAHLSQKQEWLDKAYIYTVDEPWSSSGARCVKKQWECAKAALGDIPFKTILPITSNCWMDDLDCDMFEYCLDYCNAICPQSNCWTLTATTKERRADKQTYPLWAEYPSDAAYKKYGQFRPRFDALRERGDDIWWYICIGPQPPYANWYMMQQGCVNRAVLWQQYFYDIDGILYWDLVCWQMSETDGRRINLNRINNGDGLLLYCGDLWEEYATYAGQDAPVAVPSIRFEQIRDGIEDFQYLRQLERELGREAALAYTERVTTDILVYSDDYHDIEGAREDMGFALEALACKGAD